MPPFLRNQDLASTFLPVVVSSVTVKTQPPQLPLLPPESFHRHDIRQSKNKIQVLSPTKVLGEHSTGEIEKPSLAPEKNKVYLKREVQAWTLVWPFGWEVKTPEADLQPDPQMYKNHTKRPREKPGLFSYSDTYFMISLIDEKKVTGLCAIAAILECCLAQLPTEFMDLRLPKGEGSTQNEHTIEE
ncbi:hypothetical protein DUI87_07680 [Hirundo rustica rustica]|uniref:Uncharacterized protein n=1 Tax=Hirundo rustica rustica TaxID=333673 RepID=A0A3M0KQH4_HIRRU|nr:hypothetical protein DUI87_07680 [Hirundo rustica rustica]